MLGGRMGPHWGPVGTHPGSNWGLQNLGVPCVGIVARYLGLHQNETTIIRYADKI